VLWYCEFIPAAGAQVASQYLCVQQPPPPPHTHTQLHEARPAAAALRIVHWCLSVKHHQQQLARRCVASYKVSSLDYHRSISIAGCLRCHGTHPPAPSLVGNITYAVCAASLCPGTASLRPGNCNCNNCLSRLQGPCGYSRVPKTFQSILCSSLFKLLWPRESALWMTPPYRADCPSAGSKQQQQQQYSTGQGARLWWGVLTWQCRCDRLWWNRWCVQHTDGCGKCSR
jgi:hypothetical protein